MKNPTPERQNERRDSGAVASFKRLHAITKHTRLALCSASCPRKNTLVPEVFLDFSPLERREPRSGDRFNDITSREAARKKNLEVFLSPLRDS